jgi:hypothetical protein
MRQKDDQQGLASRSHHRPICIGVQMTASMIAANQHRAAIASLTPPGSVESGNLK